MIYVRYVDKLNRFFRILVGLAFGIMTLLIFSQVLARFLFSEFNILISIPWTEEIARYLMIWSIFVGAGIAARHDRLISFEFLIHKLPAPIGKSLKIAALIVTIIFFAYIFFPSYELFIKGIDETSPVLRLPMSIIYASIPAGAVIVIMNTIALLLETWMNKKDIRNVSSEARKEEIEENIPEEIIDGEIEQRGGRK